jgi:hypothetical protein
MTDTTETTMVSVPRYELQGLVEAIRHYKFAFMDPRNNAWGQGDALAYRESAPGLSWMWMYLWFGFNHQNIKVGDTVRMFSPGDDPEYMTAEVLAVATYAALVDNSVSGVEWQIWPLIHRMDRLYTEPDFDTTHHVPVSRHMGHNVDPEAAAEYDASLAARGAAQPNLSIVKDGADD